MNLYSLRPDDLPIDMPHFRLQEGRAKNADVRGVRLHAINKKKAGLAGLPDIRNGSIFA